MIRPEFFDYFRRGLPNDEQEQPRRTTNLFRAACESPQEQERPKVSKEFVSRAFRSASEHKERQYLNRQPVVLRCGCTHEFTEDRLSNPAGYDPIGGSLYHCGHHNTLQPIIVMGPPLAERNAFETMRDNIRQRQEQQLSQPQVT